MAYANMIYIGMAYIGVTCRHLAAVLLVRLCKWPWLPLDADLFTAIYLYTA